jgi:toxin ParE1/3/4
MDLEQIAEYIAIDNPSAASNLVIGSFEKVDRLTEFPNSGRKPSELPKKIPYRELIVGPLRIFYLHNDMKVIILYVMRNERLLRQHMLRGRSDIQS